MHLFDARWLGVINPKEENYDNVKIICEKILLKPRGDLLVLMLASCGSWMLARVFMILLVDFG